MSSSTAAATMTISSAATAYLVGVGTVPMNGTAAPGETLPLATLAPPCGVRALAIRGLDKTGIAWNERFVGGGVTAVAAAALAGLAVAPLARRIAPAGLVDIGPASRLPRLGSSKVMLHSKVSDPSKLAALRTLAATFRSVVAAG